VLAAGRPVMFGPRDEVLRRALRDPAGPAAVPAASMAAHGGYRPTVVTAKELAS